MASYKRYGGTPPHVAGSDTSEEAAKEIEPKVGRLHWTLVAALERGGSGMTDEQMQEACDMEQSTQRPRRVELVASGMVCDSGERRRTRAHRWAVVWQIHRPAGCSCQLAHPKSKVKTAGKALRYRRLLLEVVDLIREKGYGASADEAMLKLAAIDES